MEGLVVKTLVSIWALITTAACGYDVQLGDCAIRCATNEDVCPNGMACGNEGLCRTGEIVAACAAIGGDGGSCLAYIEDETAFASAASSVGLSLSIEDFSRIAGGSPTPAAFVIQGGDYFFHHDRVTFKTLGVNNMPGGQANTIAVGGNAAPTPSTIMPQISGATARDTIEASFPSAVAAVAFRASDDEGMQGYMFEVTSQGEPVPFPVATAQAPFMGVVSRCGNVITSAALIPPMPSHWWRLRGVTFGP